MSTSSTLQVIHKILTQKNWTISTAESLTAGWISATLASQSGSSAYLRGGVTAYTLDAKVALLGVDRDMAIKCNCVSSETALQMALGARKVFGTECVIAVTGYAEKPVTPYEGPFVHYVVLCRDKTVVGVVQGGFRSRNQVRRLVVNVTLRVLVDVLRGAC